MANHLSDSASLYLRQHATNPVDWWAWGPEAFAEARRRDLPVMVSIGYSSCHWCHVMAEESFADPDTAATINQHFVAIKVDREEHPDVDAVYMSATQALTGQGGWPTTVFTTTDGLPFFAGTYFPPTPTGGLPSLINVLETLATAWTTRRDEVEHSARQIAEQLAETTSSPAHSAPNAMAALEQATSDYDPIHGGFGTAPKFPTPTLLDALLVKGEPSGLDMAQWTLECMARGGIHDQVGGGFHRYATDPGWVTPHFEKMLYDNAMLLGTYTRCWRRTADHDPARRALFERALFGIVDWLRRDMLLDNGAFAASMDADSMDAHGSIHEGIYYLWNPALLVDALGETDGSWARQVFHVHDQGVFADGLSPLQLRGEPDPDRLDRVLALLRAERATRFAPARDDKVVAAWNGLTIDSLVTAGMIFDEPDWIDLARGAANYLLDVHLINDRLRRTSLAGVAGTADGVTEDYACLALGLTRLAGATGQQTYLDAAVHLLDTAIDLFSTSDHGFIDAPTVIFATPRSFTDAPTPSATAAMIAALRQAGLLAARPDLTERADAAATTQWDATTRLPRHAGAALADLIESDEAHKGLARATVLIIDGGPGDRLTQAAWRMAPAGSAIVAAESGAHGFGNAFKTRTQGTGPYVIVNRDGHELGPITDYTELRAPLWTRR